MANKTLANPRIIEWGGATKVKRLILNGQTWNAGQFLRFTTGGFLTVSATGDDVAAGGLQYYALKSQTDPGDTTSLADVVMIHSDTIFEGNIWHSSAGSALAPASIIGNTYAIDVTSNICSVDLEVKGDANAAFYLDDVASNYETSGNNLATDQYGLVTFKVLTTVLEAITV